MPPHRGALSQQHAESYQTGQVELGRTLQVLQRQALPPDDPCVPVRVCGWTWS